MKCKRTKSAIAMILVAVLCIATVCPAMGAESVDEAATSIDAAVEATTQKTDEQEAEGMTEEAESEQVQDEESAEAVGEEAHVADSVGESTEESAEPASEEETTESAIEEASDQAEEIETTEIDGPELVEENQEDATESVFGGSVAQAIWTAGNSTLTFYYGKQVSGSFGGEKITNVWSGTDVTDSGNGWPKWYSNADNSPTKATRVVFDNSFSVVRPTSTYAWFYKFSRLEYIDLGGLNTSDVTNMGYMFRECGSLKNLDLSGLDTSCVTNMNNMFNMCYSLTNLNLSGFNTSNVTNMAYMFSNCSMTSLDLRMFSTSRVTNMDYMFNMCSSLASLNISSFDTYNVTSMFCMFSDCSELTSLDVSSLSLYSAVDIDRMFENCSNLSTIYCAGSTTNWSGPEGFDMFSGCEALSGIDGATEVLFDSSCVDGYMAKSASLGGYFTPKNSSSELDELFTPVSLRSFKEKGFLFRSSIKDEDSINYTYDYDDNWIFSYRFADQYSLLKTSIRVAMAAQGAKEDKGYGPANIKNMMKTMGFKYTDSSIEYPKPQKETPNTIGSAIGLRNLKMPDGSKKSVILVAIRGGGYGSEWGDNFRVGKSTYTASRGFSIAADQVRNRLAEFITKYNQYISNDLYIWITGYSRAAATSNLLAASLISGNKRIEGVSPEKVMAFCFECPLTTTDTLANNVIYDNIINIINPVDFVPKVPLTKWLFRRYGMTYTIPSAETRSHYSERYQIPMLNRYAKLLYVNGIDENKEVYKEVHGQASLLDDFMDNLGDGISRNIYHTDFEEQCVDIFAKYLGEDGRQLDWIKAACAVVRLLGSSTRRPIVTAKVTGLFKDLDSSPGSYAHYPELCLSWVDTLSGFSEYSKKQTNLYRYILVNCPVNITVRDSEGSIVGLIENDEVEEIEDGIVTRVDDDGQKVFILPQDEEYTIEMEATDDGEVNYSVQEYNFESGTIEKAINYKSIEVEAGDELVGTATVIPEEEEAEYILQHAEDGNMITPDEVLVGDEVVEYLVEVTGGENGTITGGGLYVKGEFSQVTAVADEGYEFEGWFVDGERVSIESEYRFAVENDIALEAKFSKVSVDFRGKTTRGDMFNLANNVKVTWKEVPGAKYYKVYREGITDPKESQIEPVIVTTGLIGWDKQPGLTNGHAYRYKIVASLTGKEDSSGDSPLSYSKVMYRLKTVVIRSVKNTAPGKVTVKFDKTTAGDSYVLQYCEREDMVGAKTKVVLGATNTSYVIGGLKKGKTYYISIRVRKKVNGIDYYTTFGVPKKVTIVK